MEVFIDGLWACLVCCGCRWDAFIYVVRLDSEHSCWNGCHARCPHFWFHFEQYGFFMGISKIFIYGQFKFNWLLKRM